MRTLPCTALVGLILLATPSAHVRADDPKPQASSPAAARDDARQFPVRHANPMEVAEVLRSRFQGLSATGSASAGMVIVGPSAFMDEIEATVTSLENAASARQREAEALARVKAADDAAKLEAEQAQQRAELDRKLISLDFPGGTVGQYLELVRKASGFDNIVIGSEGINALKMPPVKVKRITGTAAVMLLQSVRLTTARGYAMLGVEQVSGDPSGVGIDAESVMVVNRVDNDSGDTASVVTTEVFDLSVYKRNEPESLTALIDAVRTAVELQGPSEHFKLALHEGTGLLFVRGAEEDIEIAVRTVRTYTGSGDRGN